MMNYFNTKLKITNQYKKTPTKTHKHKLSKKQVKDPKIIRNMDVYTKSARVPRRLDSEVVHQSI